MCVAFKAKLVATTIFYIFFKISIRKVAKFYNYLISITKIKHLSYFNYHYKVGLEHNLQTILEKLPF